MNVRSWTQSLERSLGFGLHAMESQESVGVGGGESEVVRGHGEVAGRAWELHVMELLGFGGLPEEEMAAAAANAGDNGSVVVYRHAPTDAAKLAFGKMLDRLFALSPVELRDGWVAHAGKGIADVGDAAAARC